MTLQDLGNLGEFLGAIGVVATLIYLALQIRQSSRSTQANIRQQIASLQVEYINSRARDPLLRAALGKVEARQELSEDEERALRIHGTAGLRLFENYHAQYSKGVFSEADWAAMRNVIKNQFKLPFFRGIFQRDESIWNVECAAEFRRIIAEVEGD